MITIRTTQLAFRVDITKYGVLKGTSLPIGPFVRRYDHFRKNNHTGVTELVNRYRYYDREQEVLILPGYDLKQFLFYITQNGVRYQIEELAPEMGYPVSYEMQDWVSYKSDKQKAAVEYIRKIDNPPIISVALQTGQGKALRTDMPVRTPSGWVCIGDLRIGDTVIAWDGTASTVTGVYPQGILSGKYVICEDGRYVVTNDEHLWSCRINDGPDIVTTTHTIEEALSSGLSVSIPNIKPEPKNNIILPRSPEQLGLDCKFSRDIHDYQMEKLLNASPEQKHAFLEALKIGRTEENEWYTTVDSYWEYAILDIIRSIGYLGYAIDGHIYWKKTGDRIHISHITDAAPGDMVCIAIDHPDKLFVTKGYIVTHNTVSTIWGLQQRHTRAMVSMSSRIDQWIGEYLKYTDLTRDDIYEISGKPSLEKLFDQINKMLYPRVILASTVTLRKYLMGDIGYSHLPRPEAFCETLGIGSIAGDEFHEHFHTNFLMTLRFNPKLFISITATTTNSDQYVRDVIEKLIPKDRRLGDGEFSRFTNVIALRYEGGGDIVNDRSTTGAMGYSQDKLEKLFQRKGKKFFKRLMENTLLPFYDEIYYDIAREGEKFLILCYRTEFCYAVAKLLHARHPEKKTGVFISGEPVSKLVDLDVIVSTPGSAGTGRDIKMLRTTFSFISTNSEIKLLQHFGRLRPPGNGAPEDPIYGYIYFATIPKHLDYEAKRDPLYRKRGVSYEKRHIT